MKKLSVILAILCFCVFGIFAAALAKSEKIQMLPVFSSEAKQPDRLWVGTFQLVWNEFSDNIVKGHILFKDGTPEIAKQLNLQSFKKTMLSENSYYTAYGETSSELKTQIEDAIMEKFGEKSDVLDKIDWDNPNNAYLIYAMLVKNFDFNTRFDVLKKEKFGSKNKNVQYFGIDKESRRQLYNGVSVLFYNSPFDFAVSLQSDNDEVILYRTSSNKTFKELYSDMKKKAQKYKGSKRFLAGDQLKVPYMSIKTSTDYKDLCNKEILNTDRLYIGQALQTVDFHMNNTGVKLKSEAALDIQFMSMPVMVKERGRNFFFDNTFLLFMKEKDKSLPYFALRVDNMDVYKYTGKVE